MLKLRPFGKTGLAVSERGFGAWAIGSASYGPVAADDAVSALACAEELGCNFVDTAEVYGESEARLGRFFCGGRRERWVVASKYSGQPQGMTALVEEQLRRLRTDRIDFYQLHWAPRGHELKLYEELDRLKLSGKIRFCGVSLRLGPDIDHVLAHSHIDGVQLPVSLLDPDPLSARREQIRARGLALVARSALRGGFLAGRYDETSVFSGAGDQRASWERGRIRDTARQARAFGFAAQAAGSAHAAAVAYVLSFAEVSTVILGCKSAAQASSNFGTAVPAALDAATLQRIQRTQRELGVFHAGRAKRLWNRLRGSFAIVNA